jgi:hypothetical protein
LTYLESILFTILDSFKVGELKLITHPPIYLPYLMANDLPKADSLQLHIQSNQESVQLNMQGSQLYFEYHPGLSRL